MPNPPVRSQGGSASDAAVGIVVVNYHGDELTLRCVEHVVRSTWPATGRELVIVDNGSGPDFASQVRAVDPSTVIVGSGQNVGFAKGCNVGVAALPRADVLVLLNNDAFPEPGWLEPLIEALADPRVGAATPKVVLRGQYLEVRLQTVNRPPSRLDPRDLGVQLSGARINGVEVLDGVQLRDGFWGWENDDISIGGRFCWTRREAILYLPVGEDQMHPRVELRLSNALGSAAVEAMIDGRAVTATVDASPTWVNVGASGSMCRLVNNAGTVLHADGSVADRGFREPDDGTFDEPAEVFGWSATAVALSRRFVDDVGPFDDRYFLYYEDADLSWRGRLKGWHYRYVPSSVVVHEHSATVGDASPLSLHLLARNRLLTLTKNAPRAMAISAGRGLVRDLSGALFRDVLLPAAHRRPPITAHTVRLARVLGSYFRMLPRAVRDRRQIRSTREVGDTEILCWVSPL